MNNIHFKLNMFLPTFLSLYCSMGCDPTEFDRLRSKASVITLKAPASANGSNFADQLTSTVSTDGMGFSTSRLITSSGTAGYHVYKGFERGNTAVSETALFSCRITPCSLPEEPRSIIAIPTLGARQQCILMAGKQSMHLDCEGPAENLLTFPVTVADGDRFGTASASLDQNNPQGLGLFTAPNANGGRGAVFLISKNADNHPVTEAINLPGVPDNAHLGETVAALTPANDTLMFATSGFANPPSLGVLPSGTSTLYVGVKKGSDLSTKLCLRSDATPGLGGKLLLADINQDTKPELVIGSLHGVENHPSKLFIINGRDLENNHNCGEQQPQLVELACPNSFADCVDSRFGTAFAVGDINQDGNNELIVTAPRADVDGIIDAGVAFIYNGTDIADSLQSLASITPIVISPSSPKANMNFGRNMTLLASEKNFEPVFFAPGATALYLFLETALPNDSCATDDRCVPGS